MLAIDDRPGRPEERTEAVCAQCATEVIRALALTPLFRLGEIEEKLAAIHACVECVHVEGRTARIGPPTEHQFVCRGDELLIVRDPHDGGHIGHAQAAGAVDMP